jgi:hypothetical protein
MSPISKSTAFTAMAKYQRQLFRAVIPSVGIFLGIVVPLFVLYVIFSDDIAPSYRAVVGIILSIAALAAVQIPFASLRRNISELSSANGLVCPTCQAPLGDSYATLKRTGKCRRCGAQVIEAV